MKRTAALLLAGLLSLTGCTSNDASPAASEAPQVSSADLPTVPAFSVGPQGAIDDVTVSDCDTDPGAVTATGTAKNSGKFQRDVVVVVSWAAPGTSDVLARGVTQLDDVSPGESRDWQVSADVAGSQQATCLSAAYAGQLS